MYKYKYWYKFVNLQILLTMDRSEIMAGLQSGSIQLDSIGTTGGKQSDIWDIFGIPVLDGKQMNMFASCKLCFFTSKVRNSEGGRHLGTSNIRAHISKCPKREVEQVSQPKIVQFYASQSKVGITASEKLELKQLLVAHVVEGMHSFRSVEEDTLQALVQFGVRMGQRHPSGCDIPANDWVGRRTISRSVLSRYEKMDLKIKNALEYPLQHNYLSMTTDMWTDNVRKRAYMDVSAMYLASAEATELSRIGLACRVFPDVSHNADNIKKELHAVLEKFGVSHDAPITSDSASVVLRALEDNANFVCFCHRFHTCFSDAMEAVIAEDDDLRQLMEDMRTLQTYISHSQGINHRLPTTIKRACKTRGWEDVMQLFQAFSNSLDALNEILQERNMGHKMPRNRELITTVQAWITPMRDIFRELECSKRPTTHMVIVAYFKVERYCLSVPGDAPPCLHVLARRLLMVMEKKYWTSTTSLHMIAAFLHPNLKSLSILSNSASASAAWVKSTRQQVMNGTGELAINVPSPLDTHEVEIVADTAEISAPPAKKSCSFFDEMFEVGSLVVEPVRRKTVHDELADYKTLVVPKIYDNPLVFWLQHSVQFPILNSVARRVFITQASSAESERHFSCAGNIITEKRGSLAADTVEMLVLLKLNSWLFKN